MALPKEPEWSLDPHTLGKHAILREYLKAWLPILGQSVPRILFIDGFAGPGGYKGGEDGSPMIALKALAEHESKLRIQQVNFMFIEADPDRATLLQQRVDQLRPSLPQGSHVSVRNQLFSAAVTETLNALDAAELKLAPALMMVDPFGVSDVPLSVLERFLKGSMKELYISFMCEAMQRHVTSPEFAPHLDAMFGGSMWRESAGTSNRIEMLHQLYEERLRSIGATFVLRFAVKTSGRHVYSLFFATKNARGCDAMKQAMWKVAPLGDYTFNSAELGQTTLQFFAGGPELLDAELLNAFNGRAAVPMLELVEWVKGDGTKFHSGQLRASLKRLEGAQRVTADLRTRRRKAGTFPDDCHVSFA